MFARSRPEINHGRQRVMMASNMPFARYMHIRNADYPIGVWLWGCDLCCRELTQEHLMSKRHRKWTRDSYLIPRPFADFPGPAFHADSDANNDLYTPSEPGGKPRALVPEA